MQPIDYATYVSAKEKVKSLYRTLVVHIAGKSSTAVIEQAESDFEEAKRDLERLTLEMPTKAESLCAAASRVAAKLRAWSNLDELMIGDVMIGDESNSELVLSRDAKHIQGIAKEIADDLESRSGDADKLESYLDSKVLPFWEIHSDSLLEVQNALAEMYVAEEDVINERDEWRLANGWKKF